jgi:hypothetical protein
VITPLTIETAPLLFALAFGRSGIPVFVSGTRDLYRQTLNLSAMEDGYRFDLIQDRGAVRTLYEGCRVQGFELRIVREGAIKLKLDITGDYPPVSYTNPNKLVVQDGERFKEDGVKYWINGTEFKNIYGLTIASQKQGGTKTEVRIHRVLKSDTELPPIIESLELTAQLFRDTYEHGNQGALLYGSFRLTLSRLVLIADETIIDSGDTVIGPLRYYVTGGITAEVFIDGGGVLL